MENSDVQIQSTENQRSGRRKPRGKNKHELLRLYIGRVALSHGDHEMTAKLDAAEVTEASGKLNRKAKSLKQYRKLVNAQIGTSLTRANANILITISTTL